MFDPRQMASMMKQMGIKTNNISAVRAVFEKPDGTSLVIDNPEIVEVIIQGKSSYQVTGAVREVKGSGTAPSTQTGAGSVPTATAPSDEDIELVMQGAGVSRDKAIQALKESGGDIAKAIIDLGGDSSQ